jgi:hypothetical protein
VAADLAREAMLHRLAFLLAPAAESPETAAGAERPGWRPVDDDLAKLVYDSRLDPELLSSVRSSGGGRRQLTFEGRGLLLELDVVEGDVLQVICQVVPAQRARLTIRHRAGSVELGEDPHGLFQVPGLPDGPVSFRCVPLAEGTEPVATSWLAL